MSRRRLALICVPAALALLPAGALAARIADSSSPPAPAAGGWKLTSLTSIPGLKSGAFTVRRGFVSSLHGVVKAENGCRGGKFVIKGRLRIREARLGDGKKVWEVGDGTGPGGDLAFTGDKMTVGGRKQVDADIAFNFPTNHTRSSGTIHWGPTDYPYVTPCGFTFRVKHQ